MDQMERSVIRCLTGRHKFLRPLAEPGVTVTHTCPFDGSTFTEFDSTVTIDAGAGLAVIPIVVTPPPPAVEPRRDLTGPPNRA